MEQVKIQALLTELQEALYVATMVVDAVPTNLLKDDDPTLEYIGSLINAKSSGSKTGSELINEAHDKVRSLILKRDEIEYIK